MTTNKFIGVCYHCREDVYEKELKVYNDKPFHKKCENKYKEIENNLIGEENGMQP